MYFGFNLCCTYIQKYNCLYVDVHMFSFSLFCFVFIIYLLSPTLAMSNSFVNPWILACQAPLSMGLPRQEYWSGLPFPSLGDQGSNLCLLHCGWIFKHSATSFSKSHQTVLYSKCKNSHCQRTQKTAQDILMHATIQDITAGYFPLEKKWVSFWLLDE